MGLQWTKQHGLYSFSCNKITSIISTNEFYFFIKVFNATAEMENAANYPHVRILNVQRVASNTTTDEPPLYTPSWNKPNASKILAQAICYKSHYLF